MQRNERGESYQSWKPDAGGGYDPGQRGARLADPARGSLDGGGDAVRVRHIDGEEAGARGTPELLHELGAGVLVQVEDGDVAAMLGELDGCRATEAGCAGRRWGRSACGVVHASICVCVCVFA